MFHNFCSISDTAKQGKNND